MLIWLDWFTVYGVKVSTVTWLFTWMPLMMSLVVTNFVLFFFSTGSAG